MPQHPDKPSKLAKAYNYFVVIFRISVALVILAMPAVGLRLLGIPWWAAVISAIVLWLLLLVYMIRQTHPMRCGTCRMARQAHPADDVIAECAALERRVRNLQSETEALRNSR